MSDVQVSAERRREIERAYGLWARSLVHEPEAAAPLVTGTRFIIPGRVETYSDWDPVRFVAVDPRFIEFLKERGIAADIFDGDNLYMI